MDNNDQGVIIQNSSRRKMLSYQRYVYARWLQRGASDSWGTGTLKRHQGTGDAYYALFNNSAMTTRQRWSVNVAYKIAQTYSVGPGATLYGFDWNPTISGRTGYTGSLWCTVKAPQHRWAGFGTGTPTSTLYVNGSYGGAISTVSPTTLAWRTCIMVLVDATAGGDELTFFWYLQFPDGSTW